MTKEDRNGVEVTKQLWGIVVGRDGKWKSHNITDNCVVMDLEYAPGRLNLRRDRHKFNLYISSIDQVIKLILPRIGNSGPSEGIRK